MINQIKIKNFILSEKNNKTFVIAEAGVSHFGSLIKAKKLIDLAKAANADAVKFQAYKTEELIHTSFKKWFKRMKKKEVNFSFFYKLKKYAQKKNISFLLTPHSETGLKWIEKLKLPVIKVGSGEIGNFEFLNKIIKTNKTIIISTGMHEIDDLKNLRNFFEKKKFKKVIFLKCNTQYPTPENDINLKSFNEFKKIFKNYFVGYSDHTSDDLAIIGSVSLGARIIEKHISLDFNLKDAQDWKVSFNLNQLKDMVIRIRKLEKILGSNNIKTSKSEKKSKIWASRSVYANKNLKKGHILKISDVKFLRPGNHLPCSQFRKIKNKRLKKNIIYNSSININDI
jgi:N,N'-diacetyllegionaminate synthase